MQRGFVSRGKLFFNQTGSPPSPFFWLVCNQDLQDPLIPIKIGERKTSLFWAFSAECESSIYSACTLRALGLLLANGAPTVGWGETFGRVGRQKWSFGPKSEFLGPKKHTLLGSNHVLATTGKGCANKKVPFSQIDISLFSLRNIYLKHMDELHIYN